MLCDVFRGFFLRIDLAAESLSLGSDAPVHMLTDKSHVLIVRPPLRVEDSNLAADIFERVAVERRFTGGQRGAVKTMPLVVG